MGFRGSKKSTPYAAQIATVFKDSSRYYYLKDIVPMLKILLITYGKFRVESRRERVGMVMLGVLIWYEIGLASEVVVQMKEVEKLRKKRKQNQNKQNNKNQSKKSKKSKKSKNNNNGNNSNNSNSNNNNNKSLSATATTTTATRRMLRIEEDEEEDK